MSSTLLWLLLMICAGGMAATQAAVNAQLSRLMGSPIQAAFLSFLIGTLALSALLLVAREGLPSVSRIVQIPPLYFIGGLLGVGFVVAIIFTLPRVGVVNVLLFGLAGQMIVSALIDHHGWFGVRAQPVDPWRVGGIALVFLGVLVLNRHRLLP